jgi:hypothetical protein
MLGKILRKISGDDRGTTFLEVMATVLMVSVAVVGTTYALFFSSNSLREDMHREQVLRMVEQEMEYWVGRIYLGGTADSPSPQEMQGSGNTSYRQAMLDPESIQAIQVRFFYDPIVGRGTYKPTETSPEFSAYYVVTVWAEWTEPDGRQYRRSLNNEVILTTYVVPGGYAG